MENREVEIPSAIQRCILGRAACGKWPAPQMPEEWLAWLLDENEAERASRTAFSGALSETILAFIRAGVTPATLPWEKRVLGYVVYHGYAPGDYTLEDLAGDTGMELYPSDHPGWEYHAPCPDGGQHLLVPAAGPRAVFQENYWPVLETYE